MGSDLAQYRINRFWGLDQSEDETNLGAGYTPNACNFDTDEGNLAVAKGLSSYDTPVHPDIPALEGCTLLMQYFPYAQIEQTEQRRPMLISSQPSGVYLRNHSGVWSKISGATAYSSVNYQLGNQNLLVMGDFGVSIYNGTGVQSVANAPRVRYLALNHERVFGTGSSETGEMDTVYWSCPMDPYDWSADPFNPDGAGGFVNIPSFDGGAVVGLATVFNEVVVFKEHSLHRIAGSSPSTYAVARVPGDVHPVSNASIVVTGNAAYFLSREGLCVYDGVRAALVAGNDRIKDVWKEFTPDSTSVMALYRNKLHMAVGGASGRVVEYDLKRQVFMVKDVGVTNNVAGFLVFEEALLCFEHESRNIKLYGVRGTGDACLQAFWEVPWMDLKQKDAVKAVEVGYLYGYGEEGGKLVIEAWTEKKYKRGVVSLSALAKVVRTRINVRGRRVKLRFANYAEENAQAGLPAVEAKEIRLLSGVQVALEIEQD
ncbi:MAG: hypothetical protein ACOYU3_07140 [Bacillota bacterium]